jgi:foldase protein PrsA
MLIVVILFVVSCFAGYGISVGNRDGSGDYIVARIDGERVMRSQVEQEVGQMIQSMGLSQGITSEDYPSLRSTVLDQLAIIKGLDREAKERKITVSKEEIESNLSRIEQSFPTREVFMQQLQAAGMDERKLRKGIEEQVLRQKVFDQVTSPASTDEQEKRTFYDTMKSYAFQKPEGFKVNVAHFATEESAEKARAAIAGGAQWDGAMTAASGDVLNYSPYNEPILAPLDQLTGELEFLKNQAMNTVTKVVKIAEGDFMLVIKRSKETAGTAAYDEVSADIEQMVLGQKRQGLQTNFLQELRSKANVEIVDDSIFSKPDITAPSEDDPVSSDVSPEGESATVSPDASSAE